MSTQIAVRLSDSAVSFIDQLVVDGEAKSRAAYLDRLVRREQRRAVDEKAIREGRYDIADPDEFGPEVATKNAAEVWDDLD